MKKWITGMIAGATVTSLGATAALLAGCMLNLPGFQVTVGWQWLGASGVDSTAIVTLSGVGEGYDVMDAVDYPAWCVEDNGVVPGVLTTLYDSTCPSTDLPSGIDQVEWDKVNYLLNNKAGTAQEVQAALWLLTYGVSNGFPVTPAAQAMYDDAMANGGGFMPGDGEIVAVIGFFDGIQGDPNSSDQEFIFELTLDTPPGGEGCTPGFWKNDGRFGFNNWTPTGYAPTDDFDTVFGTAYFPGGLTLLDSLKPTNNGGYGKVIWHGTAALLNAASPNVEYAYTVAEVIAFVQAGDGDPLAYANEMTDCPLDRIKDDVDSQ
jgi:hypothetical protein